jgi:hypothetical protein
VKGLALNVWRAKALELFPQLRPEVEAAENVGSLWIELACRFQNYYSSGIEAEEDSSKLIRAVCLYAIWCIRSDSHDTQQAALIEFYEVIPRFAISCTAFIYKRILNDLIQNLGIEEIERSAGTIGGNMNPGELKKFLADVRQADYERQKRSRKHF